MRGFGIRGELLRWIESWLSDRLQRVGCEGAWSDWRRVLSGIPQGSVLGPILFLMFIDDLDEGLTSRILKFADDTEIFRVVKGPEDRNALQEDLRRLSDWSEVWQMKFNVDKSKVMHLGPRSMHWNYSIGGRHLKEVTEERDLGVIITNDLKVEAQCSAARKDYTRSAKRRWVSLWGIDPHDPTATYTWIASPVPGGQTRYKTRYKVESELYKNI